MVRSRPAPQITMKIELETTYDDCVALKRVLDVA